jgi:hypothetical protein
MHLIVNPVVKASIKWKMEKPFLTGFLGLGQGS